MQIQYLVGQLFKRLNYLARKTLIYFVQRNIRVSEKDKNVDKNCLKCAFWKRYLIGVKIFDIKRRKQEEKQLDRK